MFIEVLEKTKKIPSASQWNANGTFNGTFDIKSVFQIVADPVTKNHFLIPAHIDGKFLVLLTTPLEQGITILLHF